jgi:hypothetical protein
MSKSVDNKQKDMQRAEEELIESIKGKLIEKGFAVKEAFEGTDIIASKGPAYFLIEIKAPQYGHITLDAIPQVKTKVKDWDEKYGTKIEPVVIGDFITPSSIQSVAERNHIHLVRISPDPSVKELNGIVDKLLETCVPH